MTRNKRIISLVILLLFLVAGIAIGSFAWFTKSFYLGGAKIQTGELGLTCASYIYNATEGKLEPIRENVGNTSTDGEAFTGSDAAGSSISVTGGTAFKDIDADNPLTFYLIVKKNEGSIDFKYAISAFLEGLDPTYEFASGNLLDLKSGAYNYINAGGFWYHITELSPQTTVIKNQEINYYTPGSSSNSEDPLQNAEEALRHYINDGHVTSVNQGEALYNIGQYNQSQTFNDTSDCHFYALTIGVDNAASKTGTYANQTIGIRAHIMASQSEAGTNTTHTITYEKDLLDCLTQYVPGDTIKLLNSLSINGDVVFGAPVTLDLNGHTLEVTGNVRFEYNLGYETSILTNNGGRLIVRSAGSEGGYAGGDLSIVTPASRVVLKGTNSSAVGQGDIYVQGVFSVMASYDKGIVFDGCNVYAMTSEGQIPSDENFYKTINVYDATWVQIAYNTTVGEIRVANKDVKLFQLHNNGTVGYVHTANMILIEEALSSPQIDIYNNGTIHGDSVGTHITLPPWSKKWDVSATSSGNTRIVQGFRSNMLHVTGSNEYSDSDIMIDAPAELVEIQDGSYFKLIVNYTEDPNNGKDNDTLSDILNAFLQEAASNGAYGATNTSVSADVYNMITHLTVRTSYGKNISEADYAYICNFKGLQSLDLTDSVTCYGSVDIPVLPYKVLEDGTVTNEVTRVTGEYYYIPAGALSGLTELKSIRLPYDTQVILANLMGDDTTVTYPMITLPNSVLAIEMNEDQSHALRNFYVVDMPTVAQLVKVYVGGSNLINDEYAQRFIVPTDALEDYRETYGNQEEIFHWIPTSQFDDSESYLVHETDSGIYTLTAVVGGINETINLVTLNNLTLNLQDITVSEIYNYVFYHRKNIGTLNMSGITAVGVSAFEEAGIDAYENTSDVVSIGDRSFANIQLNQGIELPKLKNIGAEAFYNVTDDGENGISIGSAGILGTSTSIGDSAFENVEAKKIKFNGNVTEIGEKAFYGARTGELTFSGAVGTIWYNAFTSVSNSSLGAVTFGGDIELIKGSTNSNGGLYNVKGTSLVFEGNILGTENYAIYTLGFTEKVEAQGTVTVGSYCFYRVTSPIVLFNGKVSTGTYCFNYLEASTSVTFNGIVVIEGGSFQDIDVGTLTFKDKLTQTERTQWSFQRATADEMIVEGEAIMGYRAFSSVNIDYITFKKTVTFGDDSGHNITAVDFICEGNLNASDGSNGQFRFANISGDFKVLGTWDAMSRCFVSAELGSVYVERVGALSNSQAFSAYGANYSPATFTGTVTINHVGTLGAGLVNLTQFTDWEFQSVNTIATSFNQRKNYGSIKVNGRIEKIEKEAFKGVTIGSDLDFNDVGTIGDNAFSGANISGHVYFNGKVDSIGRSVFGAIVSEDGATYIPTMLEELLFMQDVGSIGDYAFYRLNITGEGGKELIFKGNVQSIGSYAFQNASLSKIVFEKELTNIGNYAFADIITAGATIKIMGAISDFGDNILENTKASLVLLGVKETADGDGNVVYEKVQGSIIDTIGDYAFRNCTIDNIYITDVNTVGKNAFNGSTVSGTLTFLGNVNEKIDDSAFEKAASIGTLRFMGTLNSLGKYVFAGDADNRSNITNLIFEQSIGTIGESTFTNCNITNVSFKSDIATVGARAFKNATFGGNVVFEGNVGEIQGEAFYGIIGSEIIFEGTVGTLSDTSTATVSDDSTAKSLAFAYANVSKIQFEKGVEYIGKWAFNRARAHEIIVGTEAAAISTLPTTTVGSRAFVGVKITKDDLDKYSGGIYFYSYVDIVNFDGVNDDKNYTDGADFTVEGTLYFKKVGTLVLTTNSNGQTLGGIGELRLDEAERLEGRMDKALTIKKIYLPNMLQYCSLGDVNGVQIFEWAEATDPSHITTLPEKAFRGFEFVGNGQEGGDVLVIPSQVKTLPKDSFDSSSAKKAIFKGATSIGIWCFAHSNIETLEFPALQKISGSAFHRAYGTKTIKAPELTTITGADNFLACRDLTTLYVPKLSTITVKGAFAGAPNLKTLELPGITELTVDGVFGNIDANNDGVVDVYNWGGLWYKYTYIENLSLPNLVNISAKAFDGNTVLKTLTLPKFKTTQTSEAVNGEQEIHYVSGVFQGMAGLEYLSLPALTEINCSEMFKGLANLKTVDLGNVTTIGAGVTELFVGCTDLSAIDLRSLTAINGSSTFYGLKNITSIVADANAPLIAGQLNLAALKTITGNNTFAESGVVNVVLNVETMSGANFSKCMSLKTVSMPYLTSMGGSNFVGCSELESVSMPKLESTSTSSMGTYNFRDCVKLSTINMPLIEYLPEGSFKGCHAIPYLGIDPSGNGNDIMPNIKKMSGSSVFESCKALTSVDLPYLEEIGNTAFNGCTSLETVNLPALKSIGNSAFEGCTSLTAIDFPVLTSAGSSAFENCTSLKDVDLPALVGLASFLFRNTAIETISLPSAKSCHQQGVFENCKLLKTVYMPKFDRCSNSNNMFNGCTSLTEVHMPALKEPGLYSSMFNGCTALKVVELGAVSHLTNNIFTNHTGSVVVIINGVVTTAPAGSILNDTVNGIVIGNHGSTVVSGQASAKYVELGEGWSTDNIGYYYENGILRYIYVVNGDDIQLLFCFDEELTTQAMHTDLRNIAAATGKNVTLTNNSCYLYTEREGGELLYSDPNGAYDLFGNVNADGTAKITAVAWNDHSVSALVIPNTVTVNGVEYNVTQIDAYAFIAIKDHITSLTLPKYLAAFNAADSSVSGIVFNKDVMLSKLTAFNVADGCENYSVNNGVLYNQQQTMLILCPVGMVDDDGILVIPETVTKFYIHAFWGNESIKDIQYAPATEEGT